MTQESTPQDAVVTREQAWSEYREDFSAVGPTRYAFDRGFEAGRASRDAELERVTRELAELRAQANERRATMNATHACEGCGKQSSIFTAGCDHCDYEDK